MTRLPASHLPGRTQHVLQHGSNRAKPAFMTRRTPRLTVIPQGCRSQIPSYHSRLRADDQSRSSTNACQ